MIADFTSLKTKLENKYGDSIRVAVSKPSILGQGDYPMKYAADIIAASPTGIYIYPIHSSLFSIELYNDDDRSHVVTPWDEFSIDRSIVDDDIIQLVSDLLSKSSANDVYNYCCKHDKLTNGYQEPCVTVGAITRKDNINKFIQAADIHIRQNQESNALPPKYTMRVLLPLICSIIEIIGRYATLCANNTEPTSKQWQITGQSNKFFKSGLPTIITETLTDDEQNELYNNMRCALVHAGEPFGNLKIGTIVTTNIKQNTYNVYHLWELIKSRWAEISTMPTIHPTGGFAIMECQYGNNANIEPIIGP